MTTNPAPEIESLLAIDVGTVHTRVYLFEVAETGFRYIAQGLARTTAEAPIKDIGEGIVAAIHALEDLTGRAIIGQDGRFIIPSLPSGQGVDALSATLSTGPMIKVVCAGLLADVSLESADHLAKATYARVLDRVSITDDRQMDGQIDAILRIMPEIVVLSGGSDEGASQSMLRILKTLGLSSSLLPDEKRPELLFAGNNSLHDAVRSEIEPHAHVTYTSNIRPQPEVERLDPASHALVEIFNRVRFRQILGANELNNMVSGHLLPTATSFGRMIRFLGKVYNSQRGVFGIDVGAQQVTAAVGKAGKLALRVCQTGNDRENLLETVYRLKLSDLSQWIGFNLSDEYIREYLMNKVVYPASIPTTNEDLAIEYAFTRYRINQAATQLSSAYPSLGLGFRSGIHAGFEPLIVSGTTVTNAPSLAHSLLMILDGLQPIGITTVVLDNNNLMPILGAAGSFAPALPVEVLESGTLLNLCTLIAPVSSSKPGTNILALHLVADNGQEIDLDVQQGSLTVIPLSMGETARLYVEPLGSTELGMSLPGKGGSFKVTAGAMGIVIDARGRPIRTTNEILARQEILQRWLAILGG